MLPTRCPQQVFSQFREVSLLISVPRIVASASASASPSADCTLGISITLLPHTREPGNQSALIPSAWTRIRNDRFGFSGNEAKLGIILFIGLEDWLYIPGRISLILDIARGTKSVVPLDRARQPMNTRPLQLSYQMNLKKAA